MIIYVNCYSSHTGGGITVARGLIDGLTADNSNTDLKIILLCSDKSKQYFGSFLCFNNVQLIVSPYSCSLGIIGLLLNLFYEVPRLMFVNTSLKPVLINLSDVPCPLVDRQVFYFDWSYATCSFRELFQYSIGDLSLFLYRLLKRLLLAVLFKTCCHSNFICLAQTNHIRSRLHKLYCIPNRQIIVYPNPAAIRRDQAMVTILGNPSGLDVNPYILLCLSAYYVHKNLEILPKVAHILSKSDKNFLILTTFDANTSRSAAKLDKLISSSPNICNIGRVDSKDLLSLYSASSALLLPSLLESYSGCYQESFAAGIPVLTSDLPFAREICKNAAVYFDPHCPHSIAMAIERLFTEVPLYLQCISEGSALNKRLLTWERIGLSLAKLLKSKYL